jgi:hypothetical protein
MTRKKTNKKKPGTNFPAHLKGPLPPAYFGPLNSMPSEAVLDARRLRNLIERQERLAKHHGISGTPQNKWFWLSVELAKELGLFDRPARRGVKRSVKTDDKQREFMEKVDAINAERRRGIEDAIRILQQRDPKFRRNDRDTKSVKSRTKSSLSTRYYEAVERFKPPAWTLWGRSLRKLKRRN